MRTKALKIAALLLSGMVASVASAADPTFQYGKYEEKKAVEWKANASLGLLLTTGNANQLSFTAAAMGMRHDGKNKLQLDVSGAYSRATLLSANDGGDNSAPNGVIDNEREIARTSQTVTALWNTKLRYDRFVTPNNSIYLTGFAWGNEPAGKKVVAGLQAGYSRQLYKNDMHLIVAELGYDFTYERLVAVTTNFYIHSLRAYVRYDLTVSKDTALLFDVEYLGNLNKYDGPYGAEIGAFKDSRVYGRAALNTRIWKKLAFRIAFTARYDYVPAPLPAFAGTPFAPSFIPPAQRLDTLTDASLVVSFL
jgi:hypothetical protein